MKFWFLALILVGALAGLAAAQGETHPLTPLQQARARVLTLEAENENLRRIVVSLQQQLLEVQGPLAQQQREKDWQALDRELSCVLDRMTALCQQAPPKPSAK